MNSQIFPGAAQSLNRNTHETLLSVSRSARTAQHPRIVAQSKPADRFPNIGKGYNQPNLLEPAISFLAIAGLALQVALLAAF